MKEAKATFKKEKLKKKKKKKKKSQGSVPQTVQRQSFIKTVCLKGHCT
jgi:hypothetical protein